MNSELTVETIFRNQTSRKFNIIHFNDVYSIEENQKEPKAGAARFVSLLEKLIQATNTPTLVLFSGDAISPSNVSMIVKGKQMIEILNKCHLTCACLGNHDFDFGLEKIVEHVENSNFPWLLSNVFDRETKKILGNVPDKHIIEINGIKIGIIGLVEEEWITTLSTINKDDIIYEPYIEAGIRLSKELKTEKGCEIVIALTHMRWNNDQILSENVPEIDIFLGGHDHDYVVKQISNKWVIKSGSDFKELSYIQLECTSEKKLIVQSIEKYVVDSKIEKSAEIEVIVNSYLESLNKELDVVLGYMNVELEGRFSFVRTKETNLGNFICDIMLGAVEADCAFINSGSLRSDCVHSIGEFKVRDLKKILPYIDENIVIKVTGAELHKALENSVSQYPSHEGRFLQVSGLKFAFDPTKPKGNRIDPRLIMVGDGLFDNNKEYAVMTKYYLKQGKDGFESLTNCPILVDHDHIPVLYTLVANFFKTVAQLKENKAPRLRSSVIPIIKMINILHELNNDPDVLPASESNTQTKEVVLNFHRAASLVTRILSKKRELLTKEKRLLIKQSDKYKIKIRDLEEKSMKLAPKLEDRIICIRDNEHYEELLKNFQQQSVHFF